MHALLLHVLDTVHVWPKLSMPCKLMPRKWPEILLGFCLSPPPPPPPPRGSLSKMALHQTIYGSFGAVHHDAQLRNLSSKPAVSCAPICTLDRFAIEAHCICEPGLLCVLRHKPRLQAVLCMGLIQASTYLQNPNEHIALPRCSRAAMLGYTDRFATCRSNLLAVYVTVVALPDLDPQDLAALVHCEGLQKPVLMLLCGTAGEIKRWNHHRGPMSHGSKSHRLHGSTGASATPNRTFPGQKMSGHMGDKRVKSRKLKVRAGGCFVRHLFHVFAAVLPSMPAHSTVHAVKPARFHMSLEACSMRLTVSVEILVTANRLLRTALQCQAAMRRTRLCW